MSEIEFENDYIDEMGKNVLNPCNLTKSIRNNQQDQITNIKKGNIWQEIVDEYNKDRQELNDYLTKRDSLNGQVTIAQLPLIKDLNESLFPFLCEALIAMLEKVSDEHSYFRQKSTFQGLDFISEYMYNSNPKHPERKAQWTYIFDMEWAEEHLRKFPRPHYPFSLVWSQEFAALKIQSFIRGYWVRRREDVQEVRNFWRDYKLSKETEIDSNENV